MNKPKLYANQIHPRIHADIVYVHMHSNGYIQSATLNGKPYNLSYIHHDAIIEGGKLIFEMGPESNEHCGCRSN